MQRRAPAALNKDLDLRLRLRGAHGKRELEARALSLPLIAGQGLAIRIRPVSKVEGGRNDKPRLGSFAAAMARQVAAIMSRQQSSCAMEGLCCRYRRPPAASRRLRIA